MVKPFSPTELAARIGSALRRREASEPSEPYVLGALTIDYSARRVTVAGRPVQLTAMEYRMLAELSADAGRVLTYEHLLEVVWRERSGADMSPMRTMVAKLRGKLGDDACNPACIFTEYRMLAELSADAGRVLTYEHLLEVVWRERSGADMSPMRTMVAKLRGKLGDDACNPACIFTEYRVRDLAPLPEPDTLTMSEYPEGGPGGGHPAAPGGWSAGETGMNRTRPCSG